MSGDANLRCSRMAYFYEMRERERKGEREEERERGREREEGRERESAVITVTNSQ